MQKLSTVSLDNPCTTPESNKVTRLSCIYSTIDGIVNKVNEFQTFVSRFNPAVICLTETKLNDQINSAEVLDMNQYKVYRKDRLIQNSPGGGVVILLRNYLVSSRGSVQFLNHRPYEAALWCEVLFK